MDKISVLIVTYNYGRYLRDCLNSVLSQDCGEELEILVVDDGSTDETRRIVEEFPQVRYLYQEHAGVSSARNRALKEATGSFFAFLDADDMWAPGKLRLQMNYLQAHPDCQAVFTAYENFLESPLTGEEDWVRRCISFSQRDRFCLPTALFRRDVCRQLGEFAPALIRGEDSDWTGRLRVKALTSGYIGQCLYLRRLHGQNLMNRSSGETHSEIQQTHMNLVSGAIQMTREKASFLPEGISVIIPVWNGEKHIQECVQSVLQQASDLGDLPLEVLVMNDGSTDRTAQMALDAGATVCTLPHKGVSAARNMGLIRAKYSQVFFLDGDDRLSSGALKALYDVLSSQSELMAVFSYARDFSAAGVGARYSGCLPGCALIRKSVFRKVGQFNETLQTGETVEWMVRFRDANLPHTLIDRVTLERRIHENNTGRTMRSQEQQDYARILRMHLRKNREKGSQP